MAEENAVIFDDNQKRLTKELITSTVSFNSTDIKAFATIGALKYEDAQALQGELASQVVPEEKTKCCTALHKKAVLLTAKQKQDPLYEEFIKLFSAIQKVSDDLEAKYGAEASVNTGSLIGKLDKRLSDTHACEDTRQKLGIFA